MNPVIKEKWLAALRSGRYKQGKEALKINNSAKKKAHQYCCLGVLCEIYKDEKKLPRDTDLRAAGDEVPNDEVVQWAGIPDFNPDVVYNGEGTSLTILNDGGKTFLTIADVIEEQL